MPKSRKRKSENKILGLFLKTIFWPITISIWGLNKKKTPLTLAILAAWIILFISTCSSEKSSENKQPTSSNQQTIMANMVLTEIKKHEPEPTETILPTQTSTSTQEPTATPEPTATIAIIEIPSQIPPVIAFEQALPITVPSPIPANMIAELQPNNTGYSEEELITSGRSALFQADGTKYFEGFFALPSGNYWPMNTNALQAGGTSQTLGNVPAAAASTDYYAPVSSEPVNSAPVDSVPVNNPQPEQSDCNPNYDICLPNVHDLNCPDIAQKNFRVIGVDVYKLDRDGDGIACESSK